MIDNVYPFDRTKASSYRFTSIGKTRITKEVVFTHTGYRNIVSMGFGDVRQDGQIDDKVNSNNGDIVKVLGRTYYHVFTKEFTISVLESRGDGFIEHPFNPELNINFRGFLIKRIY